MMPRLDLEAKYHYSILRTILYGLMSYLQQYVYAHVILRNDIKHEWLRGKCAPLIKTTLEDVLFSNMHDLVRTIRSISYCMN